MNHTDFYSKIQEIKSQEYEELVKAVQAHGGKYEWGEEEEKPIIAVNLDGGPIDVEIKKVYLDEKGLLNIEGENNEWGNRVVFEPSQVFAGHLSYLIDYVPTTGQVSDVSKSELIVDKV